MFPILPPKDDRPKSPADNEAVTVPESPNDELNDRWPPERMPVTEDLYRSIVESLDAGSTRADIRNELVEAGYSVGQIRDLFERADDERLDRVRERRHADGVNDVPLGGDTDSRPNHDAVRHRDVIDADSPAAAGGHDQGISPRDDDDEPLMVQRPVSEELYQSIVESLDAGSMRADIRRHLVESGYTHRQIRELLERADEERLGIVREAPAPVDRASSAIDAPNLSLDDDSVDAPTQRREDAHLVDPSKKLSNAPSIRDDEENEPELDAEQEEEDETQPVTQDLCDSIVESLDAGAALAEIRVDLRKAGYTRRQIREMMTWATNTRSVRDGGKLAMSPAVALNHANRQITYGAVAVAVGALITMISFATSVVRESERFVVAVGILVVGVVSIIRGGVGKANALLRARTAADGKEAERYVVTAELVGSVAKCLAGGMTAEAIRKQLHQSGYTMQQIEDMLRLAREESDVNDQGRSRTHGELDEPERVIALRFPAEASSPADGTADGTAPSPPAN